MYETTEARYAEKSYQPFVLPSHTNNPRILHYPRLWKRHEHLILYYKTEGSANTVPDLSFASVARVTEPINHLEPHYRYRWWMNRGRRFNHVGAGAVLNHIETLFHIPCSAEACSFTTLAGRHLLLKGRKHRGTFVGQGHFWPGQSSSSMSVTALVDSYSNVTEPMCGSQTSFQPTIFPSPRPRPSKRTKPPDVEIWVKRRLFIQRAMPGAPRYLSLHLGPTTNGQKPALLVTIADL